MSDVARSNTMGIHRSVCIHATKRQVQDLRQMAEDHDCGAEYFRQSIERGLVAVRNKSRPESMRRGSSCSPCILWNWVNAVEQSIRINKFLLSLSTGNRVSNKSRSLLLVESSSSSSLPSMCLWLRSANGRVKDLLNVHAQWPVWKWVTIIE